MVRVFGCSLMVLLVACGPSSPAGGFAIVVSGETAAQSGYPFPSQTDLPAFEDGWQLKYERVVVFVDKVTVSENPDKVKGDQSQTGALVAQLDGPFVIDLAQEGPVEAQEMNGKAWPLGSLANQNKNGNAAFDATQKYALGFSLANPGAGATKVSTVEEAVITNMVTKGYTVWVKGYAEFKGTNCRSTNLTYDFGHIPKRINFEFGYAAPVAFKNCVNPLLMPADSRGIQGKQGADTTVQLTFHLDHPFWESLKEDSPLRFDLIAAQKSVAVGVTAPAAASVTLEDLASVDFTSGKDAQGLALPWRYCGDPQSGERTSGTVAYDPNGVSVSASGGTSGLKGLADYMRYNLATMGHLNNDGLCFPERGFPAP